MQVAIPFAVSVLLPVAPLPAKVRVSVVIEIVALFADMFTNVIAEPILNATLLFAGIV